MKQGFWSIWLDLEAEIKRRRPVEEGGAAWQLPLGGMLWQTCLLYAARSFNLWNFDSNNSTTAIDRLHEEIVQRTRTLPFGCSAQARICQPVMVVKNARFWVSCGHNRHPEKVNRKAQVPPAVEPNLTSSRIRTFYW